LHWLFSELLQSCHPGTCLLSPPGFTHRLLDNTASSL
jgi:hypothetical protein